MAKSSRDKRKAKAARQPAGSRPPKERPTRSDRAEGGGGERSRTAWLAIGGIAAGVAVVVVVLVVVFTDGSSSTTLPDQAVADANAPQSLVSAADAVGFHQTTDPNTGVIEGRPASAAPAPHSTLLMDPGVKAPDFTLKTAQGEVVKLSDLRGRPVLLEFFATWCGLCNTEAPHVARVVDALAPKVNAVAINADAEDAASVFAFHRFYHLRFPAVLDPSLRNGSFNEPGVPGPVTQEYGMKSLPTYYVIDKKGTITWRSDGEQPDAKLRQELERAEQS